MKEKETSMDLRRINVMVPEDVHQILDEFKKEKGYSSKDKALAELLIDYKKLRETKP
jgi:metal-responsive CopG/Arc/MetJ family transcriptional regulator